MTQRTLKLKTPPMRGPDVAALQMLLTKKGWHVKVDSEYGPNTADAVRVAKKKIPGYPPAMVNKFAGKYFLKRLNAYKHVPTPITDRTRFVQLLYWGINKEPLIGYRQYRPFLTLLRKLIHFLPFDIDCSGIGILFAKWAKCRNDPSGWHFTGFGNTGSFLHHCRKISKAQLRPGDIVQFDNEHATYCLIPGSDPLLFSHGMQAGPIQIKLSAESRYHPNVTIYYLRFIED